MPLSINRFWMKHGTAGKERFDGIYSGDEAALVNAEKAIANKRTILLANPFLDGDKVLAAALN